MDLRLFARVLGRHKVVLYSGLALTVIVTFLSLVRVHASGATITWRKQPQYVSYSTLFVTQRGFPWGSLHPPATASPERFTSLAVIYSQYATSDVVRAAVERGGPMRGRIDAAPVLDPTNQQQLPLISIAAFSAKPDGAISLARRETRALQAFLEREQDAERLLSQDRIVLQVVRQAESAKLFTPRKKTLPIVVFVAMLLATVATACLLENLRSSELESVPDLLHVSADAA